MINRALLNELMVNTDTKSKNLIVYMIILLLAKYLYLHVFLLMTSSYNIKHNVTVV